MELVLFVVKCVVILLRFPLGAMTHPTVIIGWHLFFSLFTPEKQQPRSSCENLLSPNGVNCLIPEVDTRARCLQSKRAECVVNK